MSRRLQDNSEYRTLPGSGDVDAYMQMSPRRCLGPGKIRSVGVAFFHGTPLSRYSRHRTPAIRHSQLKSVHIVLFFSLSSPYFTTTRNMPTADYFSKCVPFPSDQPIFDLECLSYTKLKANDVFESAKLYQASRGCGFFLLNLRGSEEGERMLEYAEKAFDISGEVHKMQPDELKKYAFQPPGSLFG